MNVYLLLAIAFGAIAPSIDAPVLRRPLAQLAVRREARALTRRFAAPSPAKRARGTVGSRFVKRALLVLEVALTGAATPRAPATIG